jgi:predicted RNA polymerase sigma factor
MRIEEIIGTQHRRILAVLIRLLGDIDVAEETLQEEFAAARE